MSMILSLWQCQHCCGSPWRITTTVCCLRLPSCGLTHLLPHDAPGADGPSQCGDHHQHIWPCWPYQELRGLDDEHVRLRDWYNGDRISKAAVIRSCQALKKKWRVSEESSRRSSKTEERVGKIQVLLCDSTEDKQEKRLKWQVSWILDMQPLALGPAADHVEL